MIKKRAQILCPMPAILLFMLTLLFISSMTSVVSAQVDSTSFDINFDNSEQRALYQKIIQELRCLVCQNQTLADSNADLAKDLRRKSYEMVKQNKNYDDIIQYMLARYGEFVLYRPRVTPATWLLWFSPFVLLIALLGFVLFRIRSTSKPTHSKFSKAEIDNAKSLIDSKLSS